MIFLIGNKGLLGTDVELYLRLNNMQYIACDKEVDIRDISSLKAFCQDKKIDWIINCSGYTDIDNAENNKILVYQTNVEGIKNIIEIAKDKNSKLIHISDARIFDGDNNTEYTELDLANPKTIYGESKLECEKIITESFERYFIIRTSWLFGKFGLTFISALFKLIGSKTPKIQIVDDETGSPTYTKDLTKGLFKIILLNSEKYGIYNFSNTGKTDWFEFAKETYRLIMVYEILPRTLQAFCSLEPITSSEYITKAKRLQNSYLNSRKFEASFDFSIRRWKLALEDFISTLKK
jgi:dTDP-4-dehydrorhamnose reductase